ncbi:DUF503 family protein [Candidatus Poribacteria bacterium]|nr:DUF503 family protein [Candidatus Poribacteria bacterium]
MHIGVCTLQLRLSGNRSLKEKRRVVKSMKDRIRNRFNVSIAEVDNLDKWQWATLGVVCISNDSKFTNSILSKVVNYVETGCMVDLVDYYIEIQ